MLEDTNIWAARKALAKAYAQAEKRYGIAALPALASLVAQKADETAYALDSIRSSRNRPERPAK